jgi:polyribonucleotide nucleotidyltransferase
VDRQQQALPQEQVPIQILLSNQRPQEARNRSNNGILMRGPADSLQALHEKVLAFIKQEEKDELERSYTTSCEFPQEYIKNLIGSHGSNINKLRDEFDCEIQAQDGKVEIKGPEAKAEAAKAHILFMAKKLKDERVYELTVPPKYHRDLIGAKGSQVNRLQDRYGVRINFPRSNSAGDDDNEGSDNGHRAGRNQAPDKVIVKGPSAGADEAKREIESLLKYIIDTSFTATVSVAQSQVPSLIGAGGRELEKLRLETGAQIDVPSLGSAPDAAGRATGRVEITVKGTKDQVEKAKKLLLQRAKEFDETVTKTVEVDKRHHKALIGSGGK